MNRRELLRSSAGTVGAVGLGMSAMGALAQAQVKSNAAVKSDKKLAKLIATTSECIQIGHSCLAHCHMLLGRGETAMAECAAAVADMLASCEAVLKLASYESKHLKKSAEACAEICAACATVCEKHASHGICKSCAEACRECEKACRAV